MQPSFSSVTAAYSVRALAGPQVVDCLLALFSDQNLGPERVSARRFGDRLSVVVRQPGISEHCATTIAEKMRAIEMVESVSLECELPALKRSASPL
jgi:hypothetical protein